MCLCVCVCGCHTEDRQVSVYTPHTRGPGRHHPLMCWSQSGYLMAHAPPDLHAALEAVALGNVASGEIPVSPRVDTVKQAIAVRGIGQEQPYFVSVVSEPWLHQQTKWRLMFPEATRNDVEAVVQLHVLSDGITLRSHCWHECLALLFVRPVRREVADITEGELNLADGEGKTLQRAAQRQQMWRGRSLIRNSQEVENLTHMATLATDECLDGRTYELFAVEVAVAVAVVR
mmetsp:Transcript_43233/g.108019  ORF Transcript_43233/g.108019 Transcript_43233/m.108019 type:complete len:231 (+) Transcript_43233:108-800(+)